MFWANLLHFYQPPNQKKSILERVANESYRKIINGLLNNPRAKLTININGCLTEMLWDNGFKDIIEGIKILLTKKQIELTATAKFHPFLVKLPTEEIERQILLNEETNRKFFGESYQPIGFFPPEMAYSDKVGAIVKKLGFKWIILDETAQTELLTKNLIFENEEGLIVFFRERNLSFDVLSAKIETPEALIKAFEKKDRKDEYSLTAMDGETFGHHRPGLENLLWQAANNPKFKMISISQLISLFPNKKIIKTKNSSWSPIEAGDNPFLRWNDKDNSIHQKQWQLTNLAIKTVRENNTEIARKILDPALASDQYWWASAKPWWSLEMLESGAKQLLSSIEASSAETKIKKKAKDLYLNIVLEGFDWQRTEKVDKLAKEEDEELKQRMAENNGKISKAEYHQMLKTLTRQMLAAADYQEYERAGQIKARILELTGKRKLKVNQ